MMIDVVTMATKNVDGKVDDDEVGDNEGSCRNDDDNDHSCSD